ncbi:MAG: hypothetical protein JWO64_1385 [Hyphomicrobiales bacterium]|jgi:hypothetical protein|nr:hypothetical protein [Hyphomicrobiales bacterium]
MTDKKITSQQNELEDESFMSAADLRTYMQKMQMVRASESVQGMSRADLAREELVKQLMEPINLTPARVQEITKSLKSKLKASAERGETELMVMRFPNALCTDKGRAMNNSEADWPNTLLGRPRQAYEIWRDHLQSLGFKLSAMVIDWPHGLPGDIGFFLSWGEKKN